MPFRNHLIIMDSTAVSACKEDLEWNTFQFIKTAVTDTEKTEQAYNFVRLNLEQNKKN